MRPDPRDFSSELLTLCLLVVQNDFIQNLIQIYDNIYEKGAQEKVFENLCGNCSVELFATDRGFGQSPCPSSYGSAKKNRLEAKTEPRLFE